MAVQVQMKNGGIEKFDAAGDEFHERPDGKLEIHREDGTVKVFSADLWSTVDGKKKPRPRAAFA